MKNQADTSRKNIPLRDRLIISIDVSSKQELLSLCSRIENRVSTLKLGLEVIYNCGPDIVRTVKGCGYSVMFDAKLHDIPNTVMGAVSAIVNLGVTKITIHASGGPEMLRKATEQTRVQSGKLNIVPPVLFAVTILTSLDEDDLAEIGYKDSLRVSVLNLARLAISCGIEGIVCSPEEVVYLRENLGSGFFIATPGIRLTEDSLDDQKRTSTPYNAVKNGADFIIAGRSVTLKTDPGKAIEGILDEIKGALN